MIQINDRVLYLNYYTCTVSNIYHNPDKGLMYLIKDVNSNRLWIAHKEDIKLA